MQLPPDQRLILKQQSEKVGALRWFNRIITSLAAQVQPFREPWWGLGGAALPDERPEAPTRASGSPWVRREGEAPPEAV